jgi:hypothetical protein
MLGEFTSTEAQQLAETLAFQAAKYMQAAWQVTGEPKKDKAEVIEKEKLDYELFDRWLGSWSEAGLLPVPEGLAGDDRPRRHGEGGRTLATEFQELLVGVLLEQREVKKENDIIKRARCRRQSRRSRRTCPTSSRPTTTSAPAAASSCAA